MNDATQNSKKSFIAIEGPIGVGKTTLAQKLADTFQADVLLEGANENPFLERFYQDPKTGALPTQLYFLFQRTQQLKDVIQTDMFIDCRVSDFLMEKDRLFARVTLDENELSFLARKFLLSAY